MLWHKRSLVINCPEYLFIRKVKGVVKSVKNASKISAAGLEGFLLQGRADWRVSQTAALPAASLASQSEFLAGGCLPPWCGCPRGASRGEIFSDGPREAFPWPWCPDMQQFQCLPSLQPCWISYPWNEDLAGHWASNASAMGRGNPGAAVDAFGV